MFYSDQSQGKDSSKCFKIICCLFAYGCCHPTQLTNLIENKILKIYPAFKSFKEQEKCNIWAFLPKKV